MARWQELPMTGSSVWTEVYGNGKVLYIDREFQTVTCDFFDKGVHSLDLSEFFGALDESLNQWVIA